MHFYQQHIGDYLRETAHLSWTEDLAYRRLRDVYADREKALPQEVAATARLIRATEPDQVAAVGTVLHEFFVLGPDGWHHVGIAEQCAHAEAVARVSRENGKAGGRPRKNKPAAKPAEKQGDEKPSENPAGSVQEPGGNPAATGWKGTHNPLPITHKTHSDADASGQPAAPPAPDGPAVRTDKETIFQVGLKLLTDADVKPSHARTFLGLKVKDYGDEAVADAVRSMAANDPTLQPMAYLSKMLESRAKRGPTGAEAVRGNFKGKTYVGTPDESIDWGT